MRSYTSLVLTPHSNTETKKNEFLGQMVYRKILQMISPSAPPEFDKFPKRQTEIYERGVSIEIYESLKKVLTFSDDPDNS